ncbi:MAG: DUF1292 domain-containing protein [Bacilli bacterium]|nr:DUF1292 domain-containing protein [Bacilli bacterium]MDD4608221.1 DUF1292 domain-containing protein [Bacilli bacterium]
MEEKNMIRITDIDGVEKEVEVITHFTLAMNGKDYIIYTENKTDASGNVEIYTSEVVENEDGNIELNGVTDETVWTEIKKVMVEMAKGE